MLVVAKFGGSTLSNAEDYKRVARVVAEKRKNGEKVVAVVSAMYNSTNELIAASTDKDFQKIFDKHTAISRELGEKAAGQALGKMGLVKKKLDEFREISEPEKRLVAIQTIGERLSAVLLEAFLLDAGVSAKALVSEEAGIIAAGSYERGVALLDETRKKMAMTVKPLVNSTVPIITGYYGVSKAGELVLFGRGGSDYSAGVIAACIGAEALEFWKDVSGFLTADPKIVPKARLNESISYREAEELGYLGAKIMHPRAVLPLKGTSTPVYIRNISNPDSKGTVVVEKSRVNGVKAVAGKEAVVITVREVAFAAVPGMAGTVFSALAKANVSVDLISTSEVDISFTTDPQNADKAVSALKKLPEIEEVTVEKGAARIGVVGEGLKESGAASKLFSYLSERSLDVKLVSQDAKEVAISFVVPKEKMSKCINEIHAKLIE